MPPDPLAFDADSPLAGFLHRKPLLESATLSNSRPFLSGHLLPNFLKESSTPSASTSSPPTHSLTPCNLASSPQQPPLPGHQASSHQTRQHSLRLMRTFCSCLRSSAAFLSSSLACTLRGHLLPLQPGLQVPRGSSSLPCPVVGTLCPANQHILPEWLLCGFLFLHLSIGEVITPLLHLDRKSVV